MRVCARATPLCTSAGFVGATYAGDNQRPLADIHCGDSGIVTSRKSHTHTQGEQPSTARALVMNCITRFLAAAVHDENMQSIKFSLGLRNLGALSLSSSSSAATAAALASSGRLITAACVRARVRLFNPLTLAPEEACSFCARACESADWFRARARAQRVH